MDEKALFFIQLTKKACVFRASVLFSNNDNEFDIIKYIDELNNEAFEQFCKEFKDNMKYFILLIVKYNNLELLKKIDIKHINEFIIYSIDIEQIGDIEKYAYHDKHTVIYDRKALQTRYNQTTELVEADISFFTLACIYDCYDILDYFMDKIKNLHSNNNKFYDNCSILLMIIYYKSRLEEEGKKDYKKVIDYIIGKSYTRPRLWNMIFKKQGIFFPMENYPSSFVSNVCDHKRVKDEIKKVEEIYKGTNIKTIKDFKIVFDTVIDYYYLCENVDNDITMDDIHKAFNLCYVFDYPTEFNITKKLLQDFVDYFYPEGLYKSRFFQPKYKEKYDEVIGQIGGTPPIQLGKIKFQGNYYTEAEENFNQTALHMNK